MSGEYARVLAQEPIQELTQTNIPFYKHSAYQIFICSAITATSQALMLSEFSLDPAFAQFMITNKVSIAIFTTAAVIAAACSSGIAFLCSENSDLAYPAAKSALLSSLIAIPLFSMGFLDQIKNPAPLAWAYTASVVTLSLGLHFTHYLLEKTWDLQSNVAALSRRLSAPFRVSIENNTATSNIGWDDRLRVRRATSSPSEHAL